MQIGWSNLKHSDRAGDYLPQTDFNLRSIQDFQASISFNVFVLDNTLIWIKNKLQASLDKLGIAYISFSKLKKAYSSLDNKLKQAYANLDKLRKLGQA